MIAKLLMLPALVVFGAEQLVSHTASTLIVTAAAVGAVAVIWRTALVPAVRLAARTARAVDAVLELHGWQLEIAERFDGITERQAEITRRLDEITERQDRSEKHLDVMAGADRDRVKDALAGDPRSPVDRRSTRP